MQRLARREGRCSNTSVSSTDSAQAVSLREPIVLLERTELTAKQLSDTAPTVTVSKTNLKQKAEQAEIKIALSQSKEAESRLQKCHANDESRSPDIQRLPTPPRSKRPRRENGAATTATESGGSASETTIALSSCIGSNETQTCEARNEPGTAPPARSTSLGEFWRFIRRNIVRRKFRVKQYASFYSPNRTAIEFYLIKIRKETR